MGFNSGFKGLTSDNAIFLGQLVGFTATLAGGYQPPK